MTQTEISGGSMNTEEIIEMARYAGFTFLNGLGDNDECREYGEAWIEQIEAFAKLVDAKATARERELCALEAESLWATFQDTKDAHERNSPKPFMPERFGFDQSLIWQSRKIADKIRNRGDL